MNIHPNNRGNYIIRVLFTAAMLFAVHEAALAEALDSPLLHVLVVADTNDVRIGKHVLRDQETVVAAVEAAIPAHRRTLKVLSGDQATPENVLQYYRELQNGTDDTLLFYYAGHGAVSDEPGHVLTLQIANLSRRTLVKTINAKRARLNIILTDCCSVFSDIKQYYAPVANYDPVTIRYLFFRHRGTVDLTAADIGKPAYGSNSGGIFTNSLFGLLKQSPDKFDPDGDGVPSWEGVWAEVQRDAVNRSKPLLEARDKKLGTPDSDNSMVQVPFAFAELASPVGAVIPNSPSRLGVDVETASTGGAVVTQVYEDSPASWYGFEVGDVIAKFAGREIATDDEFTARLAMLPEGLVFPVGCEMTRTKDGVKTHLKLRLTL